MRKTVGVVLAASLLLAGCADDEPDTGFAGLPSPSPSASTSPSPSASAEAQAEIDVTTTPDEITPEWVTAVVNTLLAEYGEMTAEILATPVTDDPTLPEGFEDRLEQLFAGEYLDFARSELIATQTSEDRRSTLLPPQDYGGLQFLTDLVQIEGPQCIVAVGRIDRSNTTPEGGEEELSAVALSPVTGTSVPWLVRDILANTGPDGSPNEDATMLQADLATYGDALDHTCSDT